MASYPPHNPLPPPGKKDMSDYAVVITDMWDKHWCKTATRRIDELAPEVNRFVKAARDQHALIIHAPSDAIHYYKGNNARDNATKPKKVLPSFHKNEPDVPVVLGYYCGCEDIKTTGFCGERNPFNGQHKAIEIDQRRDAISADIKEMYALFKEKNFPFEEKKITRNVLILGVHLNQCVLSTRNFSLNTLAALRDVGELGAVHLVRDLTDTMFETSQEPKIDHHVATDVVAQYIEQTYKCPSHFSSDLLKPLSSDLLKPPPYFNFSDDHRYLREPPAWSEGFVKLQCYTLANTLIGPDGGNGGGGWLEARSDGTVGLADDRATIWQLETFGRDLYFLRTPDNRYLNGNPAENSGAITTSKEKQNGTRWWVPPRGDHGDYWLYCCSKAGPCHWVDGDHGALTMQGGWGPYPGTEWLVHPA